MSDLSKELKEFLEYEIEKESDNIEECKQIKASNSFGAGWSNGVIDLCKRILKGEYNEN